jgi:hypothetical protein
MSHTTLKGDQEGVCDCQGRTREEVEAVSLPPVTTAYTCSDESPATGHQHYITLRDRLDAQRVCVLPCAITKMLGKIFGKTAPPAGQAAPKE